MNKVWDTTTQEPHGGQSWRHLPNFLCDFSVTTNALGPPPLAVSAAQTALSTIHHYPPCDNEPVLTALCSFINFPKHQVLLGNGASELIDLAMRVLPPGPLCPGPFVASYMEYKRAARAVGREVLEVGEVREASVTVVIRPNSPTGEFMSLVELRKKVQQSEGVFLIDESFLPFMGPLWREESALELVNEFEGRVVVVQSWTKIWSCPGLRLGSLAASKKWVHQMKKVQTPWSVNVCALAFCEAAVRDVGYLRRTWSCIKEWRKAVEDGMTRLGWGVRKGVPDWVPWVFVRVGADWKKVIEVAEGVGCPVRGCESYGAGIEEWIRIGVRGLKEQAVLFAAWEAAFGAVRSRDH